VAKSHSLLSLFLFGGKLGEGVEFTRVIHIEESLIVPIVRFERKSGEGVEFISDGRVNLAALTKCGTKRLQLKEFIQSF
jgi:hypothetical protein